MSQNSTSSLLRRRARSIAIAVGLMAIAAPAFADGASASGNGFGEFRIGCTTCPHFVIPLPPTVAQADGGTGASSASVSYAGNGMLTSEIAPYSLGGGISYDAAAAFEGALGTPLLRARASADNEPAFILADPNRVFVGIDLYQSSAQANTVRQYHYLGSGPTTYTFNFGVDAMLTTAQSGVFAAASIYSGVDPDFEVGLLDFGSADFKGTGLDQTPTTQQKSFSVSVNVNQGDSFYLLAQLSALASITYASADVSADAYNTMRLTSISGGDTQLLQAAPVPEPSAAALLGIGLLAMLALLRRRG